MKIWTIIRKFFFTVGRGAYSLVTGSREHYERAELARAEKYSGAVVLALAVGWIVYNILVGFGSN